MSSRNQISGIDSRMVAFTDSQLRTVRAAADRVPAEKRGTFVDRVVARLQRQRGFTDADLDDAVRAALQGLVRSAAVIETRRFPPPWTVEETDADLAKRKAANSAALKVGSGGIHPGE
jgi:hypothetical protein